LRSPAPGGHRAEHGTEPHAGRRAGARPRRPSLRAALFAAALVLAGCQSAPTARPPVAPAPAIPNSAIFIGNSFFYFNNGITAHLTPLIRAAEPATTFRSTMVTISGSGFDWHDVDSYFRPNGIGTYSFDANNNVVFNKLDRLFDAAILMDCSQCPVHPQLKSVFREYAKKNADTVRKYGTRPVFFMSWAYSDAAPGAEPVRAQQAPPEPRGQLPGRVHDLRIAVRQVAGGPRLHRGPGRGRRALPADGRLGHRAGVRAQLRPPPGRGLARRAAGARLAAALT
jgi:hypothetical protein